MTNVKILLAFALLGSPDPKAVVVPGKATATGIPVTGSADVPVGTVVKISATRVERRWSPEGFVELLAVETRRQAHAEVVAGRRFSAQLPLLPSGLYEVGVSVKESGESLYAGRILIGSIPDQIDAMRVHAAALIQAAADAAKLAEELRKLLVGETKADDDVRQDWIARLTAKERAMDEQHLVTDLTATTHEMKELFYLLRNAQAWRKRFDKERVLDARGLFVGREGLTPGRLIEEIKAAAAAIPAEVRLSLATLLPPLLADAGNSTAARRDAELSTAAAGRLLKSLPGPDVKLAGLIEGTEVLYDKSVEKVLGALKDAAPPLKH